MSDLAQVALAGCFFVISFLSLILFAPERTWLKTVEAQRVMIFAYGVISSCAAIATVLIA